MLLAALSNFPSRICAVSTDFLTIIVYSNQRGPETMDSKLKAAQNYPINFTERTICECIDFRDPWKVAQPRFEMMS